MYRHIPPTAVPIRFRDLLHGLRGLVSWEGTIRFERDLAEYLQSPHCFLFSSGRAALAVVFEALHREVGRRKVVLPAYTCFSVPSAAVRAGFKVVPCDIQRENLGMDSHALVEVMDSSVLCVVPTHLLGVPSTISPVLDLAHRSGALMIEDAAQAMGVRINGTPLGSIGDVGIFSLGRGKHLTTGSGGLAVTRSEEWAWALNHHLALRNGNSTRPDPGSLVRLAAYATFTRPQLFGMAVNLPMLHIGESIFSPSFPIGSLGPVRAEMGISLLRSLDQMNGIRRQNARRLVQALKGMPGIDIPSRAEEGDLPLLRVPVLIDCPDVRQQVLAHGKNLGISSLYPSPVHKIPQMKGHLILEPGGYPVSELIARELITLPCHPFLSDADMDRIIDVMLTTRRKLQV